MAMEIKRRIWASQKMTCSIGISAVRFVAKMASGAQKPDGLTIIEPGKEKEFLWPQPIGNLWGVGPKSQEAFHKLGVNTIGDLANFPKHRLKKYFGIVGEALLDMANGKGNNEIQFTDAESNDKSMGHEHTFDVNVTDIDRILAMLMRLSDKVSRRLRHGGYQGRTVTLKIKHADARLKTRSYTFFHPTDCATTIYNHSRSLLDRHDLASEPVRLIGVSVSKLARIGESAQGDLLGNTDEKIELIDNAIDLLRDKYGEQTISYARSNLI
jgi:DNA polymerase-4